MPPASSSPPIRLVIGLGNPGREYAMTRHNIGFLALDRLASQKRASFAHEKKWQGEVARAGDVYLLKPQTYMNLSGESANAVARFYRIEPASVLIVYDDKDLPFGHLRLREGGSAGGHNGVKSLIQHFGTEGFPRLRIGIGAPKSSLVNHVLGGFSPEERESLDKALDRAVEAINCALFSGFAKAMNAFNRNEPPPAPKSPPTPPAATISDKN